MSLWSRLRGGKGVAGEESAEPQDSDQAASANGTDGAGIQQEEEGKKGGKDSKDGQDKEDGEGQDATSAARKPPEEEIQRLEPITPQRRRVLQQAYVSAKNNYDKANFQYAAELLPRCVCADPGNLEYTKLFLDNLHKLYKNNKRGKPLAALQGASHKMLIRKARGKKDWLGVYKAGVEMLNLNPWDVSALLALGEACRYQDCEETELFWLRAALDTNPKDPKLNREAALALERQGDFAQAITCWHRVEEAKPDNEEALKKIGQLTAERTMSRKAAEQRNKEAREAAVKKERPAGGESAGARKRRESAPEDLSDKDRLKKAIEQRPEERQNYVDLAEVYVKENQLDKATKVLSVGLQAMGGSDLEMREQLEDYRIMRVRQQLDVAMRRAQEEKTDEAKNLARKFMAEVNRVEAEVYAARCERSPNNETLQYELGVRLRKGGNYSEAIKHLQQARGEGRRQGAVFLELGICFQKVERHRLAMANFEQAIESGSSQDLDVKKQALYSAGCLAMGLEEWEKAEKYLTELAGLDYGYRDVAQRLDELPERRDD